MRCEEPVTIFEILRLAGKNHSQRQIAKSVKVSKTTVHEIQKRCREIGLSYNQESELLVEDIKTLVYPLYGKTRTKTCNTCEKITGQTTLKA